MVTWLLLIICLELGYIIYSIIRKKRGRDKFEKSFLWNLRIIATAFDVELYDGTAERLRHEMKEAGIL